jgi:UMF1 family MFS transporter
MDKKYEKKSILAFCLYDAGNSAFATVIITFVFSVYFERGIVGDETRGAALWSYAIAASGFLVAILSPVLGAVADHYGARKPGLALFSALCVIPCALLYFAAPGMVTLALALLVVANTAFEIALVYANAMLPHLAPPGKIGRVSGWAWGAGYAGGLACLVLALFLLVGLGDMKPLLPLPREHSEYVRAAGPLTALWFAALTIPLLLWTHDVEKTGLTIAASVRKGLRQLRDTARAVRHHKNLLNFLIASALYRDGLNTLFAVGGIYAARTFGMSFTEILVFAIGLNITAGLGAVAFAHADDRWGSKRTVMLALAGLTGTGITILLVQDKYIFIACALALGIFMGPAQAAGRTWAARLSPPGMIAQTYGLYSLTGKAVSFFGPLAFGLATDAFDSQRAGMATIILFWLAGMALLVKVKES